MKAPVLTLVLLVLISCKDDINNFDLESDPLDGKIAGNNWSYVTGNGRYSPFENDVTGLLLGNEIQDPCAVRISADAHLAVKFPLRRGNYTLPFINDDGYVIFNHENGTKRLTAVAGFIQIVAISNVDLIGYINADFDDNNDVEGSFLLRICD